VSATLASSGVRQAEGGFGAALERPASPRFMLWKLVKACSLCRSHLSSSGR
jgi:hypothetical protein